MQVLCPNQSRGCRVAGNWAEVKQHVEKCTFKPASQSPPKSDAATKDHKEETAEQDKDEVDDSGHAQLQLNYEVMCVFSSYGCRHSGEIRDLPKHVEQCEFRIDFTRSKEIKVSCIDMLQLPLYFGDRRATGCVDTGARGKPQMGERGL